MNIKYGKNIIKGILRLEFESKRIVTAQKIKFSVRISSLIATKTAVSYGSGHTY